MKVALVPLCRNGRRTLGCHKMALEPLQSSVYYTDFQGVRYIALDSMQALQSEEYAILQADWLRESAKQ